jgi:hypothetical protein
VGRYDQQFFKIGSKDAIGAYFNASQCADIPDTVGWFAGLNQYGGNFLFYVYVDPIQAYNEGRGEIQKVLDTVVFRPPVKTAPTLSAPPTNTLPGATAKP